MVNFFCCKFAFCLNLCHEDVLIQAVISTIASSVTLNINANA